ncbi:hypothetical protein [Cryobacterium sp. Hb1]|uniref:hypothetical protein n=1 Tax=Cryobacterium sp. Hb1 TaxID=1259147 RepID=UPI00106CC4E7|nr:hypothetical protein [Cryobacterium sp. Hb1]TFD63735.1 hypothetical protein E3T38_16280 [Cryobacterium sp. Hb1]
MYDHENTVELQEFGFVLITPVLIPRDDLLLLLRPISIRQSVGYLLTQRRNAWHSTMLNQYSSSEPIFTNLRSAQKAAERHRKSGTYFEISEKPILAFNLGTESLIVAHLNDLPPFERWKVPKLFQESETLICARDLVRAFGQVYFGQTYSGWCSKLGRPEVIVGFASTVSLEQPRTSQRFGLRKSQVQSGNMHFSLLRTAGLETRELARVALDLSDRGVFEREHPWEYRVSTYASVWDLPLLETIIKLLEANFSAYSGNSWIDSRKVREFFR